MKQWISENILKKILNNNVLLRQEEIEQRYLAWYVQVQRMDNHCLSEQMIVRILKEKVVGQNSVGRVEQWKSWLREIRKRFEREGKTGECTVYRKAHDAVRKTQITGIIQYSFNSNLSEIKTNNNNSQAKVILLFLIHGDRSFTFYYVIFYQLYVQ